MFDFDVELLVSLKRFVVYKIQGNGGFVQHGLWDIAIRCTVPIILPFDDVVYDFPLVLHPPPVALKPPGELLGGRD